MCIRDSLKGKLASAESENTKLEEVKSDSITLGGGKFRLVVASAGRRVFLPRATFEALSSFGSVKVREFAHE